MTNKLVVFFRHGSWKRCVAPLFYLLTIAVFLQLLHSGNYNNILIFRSSSLHLLSHQPLYVVYPQEYFDYFLYHPSFSVLFLPLALLPAPASLCLWLCFSSFLFVRTVHMLPGIDDTAKKIMLLLVLPEFMNNQQDAQTNIVLVSVMLLVFIQLEKQRLIWAAFFTILAFCIKGYGGIAGMLFLLYPGKFKFMAYSLVWGVILCALPLLFISFTETISCYRDWLAMISSDEIKEALSVMGVFGNTHVQEFYITIMALLILAISVAYTLWKVSRLNDWYSRAALCCYLLAWVVLFNRAAESPTYQIILTGICYSLAVRSFNRTDCCLFALLFVIVYLFPSDLLPSSFHAFFKLHRLKVYPFLFYFVYQQWLIFRSNAFNTRPAAD